MPSSMPFSAKTKMPLGVTVMAAIAASLQAFRGTPEACVATKSCHRHDALHDLRMHFFHRGDVAARASVELHGHLAVDSQTHVLEHLAVAQFDHQDLLHLLCRCGEREFRKRPQRDRAKEASLQPFAPSHLDRRAKNTAGDPVT